MKEPITKFDLETAFKALDEIEAPKADKVKANRPALTEIFSRKSKFDALMEEYYDISNMTELDDAKEAREAEVAQAKLARIEKIVDLDAESPEDLLPSYVGKFIMQCPQCMTLFYKDPEDVEASEEDPNTVNVNEVCQHCGNDSGYTLIGKVGEATEEEVSDYREEETIDVDSTEDSELEEPVEEQEENSEEEIDLDAKLGELNLDLEEEDEEDQEKTEESFSTSSGEQVLVEQLTEDAEVDVSADEFEKLISSPEFKKPISDTEARAMMDELEESTTATKCRLAFESTNDLMATDCTGRLCDIIGKAGLNHEDAKKRSGNYYVTVTGTEEEINNVKTLIENSGFFKAWLTEAVEEVNESLNDDNDVLSDRISDMMYTGKFLNAHWIKDAPTVKDLGNYSYKLTHPKGGAEVVVKFDMSNTHDATLKFDVNGKQFATKFVNEAQDFVIKELDAARVKSFDIPLDEGVLDNIKSGIGRALNSRSAKADWILANALEDYTKAKADTRGQLVPDETNQRFNTFVVVGFKDKYSNGKVITMAPSFNNKDLVLGNTPAQEKKTYKDAEKFAKGWSMMQGNGPAFIYLAKSKDDPKAVFLCEYFKGELENDQLEKYYNVVKDHLKGAKLIKNSGGVQDEQSDETPAEGPINHSPSVTKAKVVKKTVHREEYHPDNLSSLIEEMEELQEASLERFISDSLVESYGNVAGFRLTECAYADNKLSIDGTIYFTSGNKRKTTYVFSEAMVSDNKVSIRGLNEKLGLDKQFTITGCTDDAKTFITESFNTNKK